MNFKHELMQYELSDNKESSVINLGKIPIIITAVHTMRQEKEIGFKKAELFTKSIAQYAANHTDCSYYIKLKDDGIDSNSLGEDNFKENLLQQIKDHKIKMLIDIHGANINHDFDIEIGTLNNLSADFSTIKELTESFNRFGLKKVSINNLFKGGGITQYIYGNTDIDFVQIEVNQKFRDYDNFDNIEKLCNSLIDFINQYKDNVDY